MAVKDYYKILNVDAKAPGYVIKNNYRKLAMKYHPDLNPDDELTAAIFTDIAEAYSVLSDHEKRKQYNFRRYLLAPQDYVKPTETIDELLMKSDALYKKIQSTDAFRINRDALLYTLQQLIPSYEIKSNNILHFHLQNLVKCASYLNSANATQLQNDLHLYLNNDAQLNQQLNNIIKQLRNKERWNTYKVILAMAATALLCAIIFTLSH